MHFQINYTMHTLTKTTEMALYNSEIFFNKLFNPVILISFFFFLSRITVSRNLGQSEHVPV